MSDKRTTAHTQCTNIITVLMPVLDTRIVRSSFVRPLIAQLGDAEYFQRCDDAREPFVRN